MDIDRLAGALADRYRLGQALGRGGMATVYLADDERHGRKVAIKVRRLRAPGLPDTTFAVPENSYRAVVAVSLTDAMWSGSR